MRVILGIDLGTSSVKAVIIDLSGKMIGMGQKEYGFDIPFEGWAEQDPNLYWNSTVEAIRQAISISKVNPKDIYSVGLSGHMHGLVALDKYNKPVRKAIIWCDQRSKKQVKKIEDTLGKENIAKIAHSPIAAGFQIASLLWVKENECDIYRKIHKVILPKDYIKFKLTGIVSTEITDAAGTLALDSNTGKWSTEILSGLGIDEKIFPPINLPESVAGSLTKESADLTGLDSKTLVVHGGADQVMQAVGNGILSPGQVSITIGTGGQVLSPLSSSVYDCNMSSHTFNFLFPNSWYFLGATLSAGLALKWFKNTFSIPLSYDEIDKKVGSSPIGSNNLIFLPYLGGERTPYMNPEARAVLFGMTHSHNIEDIYRSIMEGVVFSLYDCLEVLKNGLNQKPASIIASGGGATSSPWRHMISDMTGLPVQTSLIKEQASVGAAITAGVGTGCFESYESACSKIIKMKECVTMPNKNNHEQYLKYFEIYKELYSNTSNLMTLIGDII